jgi:hypothetical protein
MKTIEKQLAEAKEYCEADRDTLVARLEDTCKTRQVLWGKLVGIDPFENYNLGKRIDRRELGEELAVINDRIWDLEHQIAVWDAAERTWTEEEMDESNFGSFDDLVSEEL